MAVSIVRILVFLTISFHSVTSMSDFTFDEIEIMKNTTEYYKLFNFYDKIPKCDGSNDYSVLVWGTHCIMLCDGNGESQTLDRDKNKYDLGLGDRPLEEAFGGDQQQLADEACDPPKSVIDYEESENDYVRICNEQGKIEIMSKTYSRCPSGAEHMQSATPDPEGYSKPCGDIKNNEAIKYETRKDGVCNVLYCCNGDLMHTNGEDCDIAINCVEEGP